MAAASPGGFGGMTPARVAQFTAIVLAWSTSWFLITLQLGKVNPTWSVGWRFLFGGVFLLAWCKWKGHGIAIPRGGWKFVAVLALLQFVLNFNFVYRAEQHLTSGVVAAAYALLMIPNAVLAALFLKRRPTRKFILGSMLGVVGVGLLFSAEFSHASLTGTAGIGLLFTVAGLKSASGANVLQATPAAYRLPPLATLGWAMLVAACANLAWAAVVAGAPAFEVSLPYWAAAITLGMFASAIAFALYFDLIRTIGPAEAAWTGVPIPIVAMLISTVVEGYRWTWPAAIGAVIAISGLVVALIPSRSPKA